MKKRNELILTAIIFGFLFGLCGCKEPLKNDTAILNETPQQKAERMEWWTDARFGMFIHWGLYAIPAGQWNGQDIEGIGEWIMHKAEIPVEEYEPLAERFNPTQFNADEWVWLAKNAGMKYLVITSKHHDGFCLWDSKVSDYDVIDRTPFKRDILKELSQACRKYDIKFCLYYSILDWHHPDAKGSTFPAYVENYMKPQLAELIENYGPLGVLWFDGEWIEEWTDEMGWDLYAYLRGVQPDLVINNRISKGRQGMQGMNKSGGHYAGDFGTPEQEILENPTPGVYWESCMTMNDTWGFKTNDHNWKSTQTLIHNLVDSASKGGNYLLNVGPTAKGKIPQPSIERLEEIGQWMQVNSESIYGTALSPIGTPSWGRCTAKPGFLYLHVFNWPENQKLEVQGLTSPVKNAYMLNCPKSLLEFQQNQETLTISLPSFKDPFNTVIVLETQ